MKIVSNAFVVFGLGSAIFTAIACTAGVATEVDGGSGSTGNGNQGNTTPGNGNGSSNGTDSGSISVSSCTQLQSGNYLIHYTSATSVDGKSTCNVPGDTTVTLSNDGTPADGGAGEICQSKQDKAACSTTITCAGDTGGFSTTINELITSANGSLSGTSTVKSTQDSSGTVLVYCDYGFTLTKQ